MKTFASAFLVFSFFIMPAVVRANEADPLIHNVVNHLKQDLENMKQYGSHQRVITTKLNDQGAPKRVEEKGFRTIWVHDKAKNELVNFTCNEIDVKSGKSRRCSDVKKAKYQKNEKPGKIEAEIKKVRWTDIHNNFRFRLLPADGPYHVISFSPKEGTSPNNRIEKLLGRMAGKVWIDRQFNVVRAEASLVDTVSFGLGIAAKVQHLAILYRQQPYRSVWLPSALTVDFKAKVALVHTERQRIEVFWTGPYQKSDTVWAQASPLAVSGGSTRR